MKRTLGLWIALIMLLTSLTIPLAAAEGNYVLPEALTVLEDEAFEGDTGLTAIVIPKNVKRIGSRAFADCSNLQEVYFGKNEGIDIAKDAFAGCDGLSFYVYPDTPAELYALSHGYDYGLMEPGSSFLEKAMSIVAATGGTENVLQSADFSSRRLIVRTADNRLPDISEYNPVEIARDGENTFFIQFDDVGETIDCYYLLQSDDNVIFADSDANLELLDDVTAAGSVSGSTWDTDDPMGFEEYSAYVAQKTSGNVTIAVIDSGVSARSAYQSNLLEGVNLVPDGQTWSYDPSNHGSAIASIIKDCAGNANVKILPIRVVGSNGIGSLTLIGAGIKSAIERGVDIINLSMNFEPNAYVTQWINVAVSRGITVVVAAGNNSRDIRKVYPAYVDGVVAVSGIDSSYSLSASSNYGDNISYCAPDMYITPSAFSGSYNGTSFAAPMISTALALLKLDPYHNLTDLRETCRDLGAEGRDSAYGYGLPQLSKISKVYVDSISLSEDIPAQMAVGTKQKLEWSVLPEYATDKTVSFESSNDGILAITTDESGNTYVNALGQGSAMISVSANNVRDGSHLSSSAEIVVVQPVTSISVYGTTPRLALNKTLHLTAEVSPADATAKQFTWMTTNDTVATISEEGVLTPVSEGSVGVYAVANDGYGAQSQVATIEIVMVPDAEGIVLSENTGIDVSSGSIQIVPGAQLHLNAQVMPEDAEQSVIWSSNDSAITVDSSGVVTAQSAGNAKISAVTSNGIRAELNVEAVILPISITVNGSTIIDVNSTSQFSLTFDPADTTDTSVTWRSTRPDVASVDQNGVVTGVSSGPATIIAESTRNKVPGSIQVTVRQPYTLMFNANGGSVSTASKTAYSGYSVGELPTPTLDYNTFEGWYTQASGGTRVTATSVLTSSDTYTIYAHWKEKPLSDWVLESQVPAGAQIVNRANPEYIESTQSSLAGWVSNGNPYWKQIGHSSILYGSKPEGVKNTWINNQLEDGPLAEYNNGKTKRVVTNEWTGYVYWHWMYDCGGANGHSQRPIYNRGGEYPNYVLDPVFGYGYKYFGAFMDSTNYPYGGTLYTCNLGWANYIVSNRTAWEDCQGATRWFRFDYYKSTYTDYEYTYKYTRTRVQYREK